MGSLSQDQRWTNLFLAVVLCALAFAGNALSLTLFNTISFIFGSIFALIALRTLGLAWGVIVAAVGASYTIMAWGHPYAVLTFTAEVLVVGLLLRRTDNIALADAVFWVGGILLVLLFYVGMLGLPFGAGIYIALKQMINGVFNAVVAGMLLMLLRKTSTTFRVRLPKISANTLLFYMIAFVAILSTSALVVVESRSDYRHSLERMSGVMSVIAEQTLDEAERAGLPGFGFTDVTIGPILQSGEVDFDPQAHLSVGFITDDDDRMNVIGRIASIGAGGTLRSMDNGVLRWSPDIDAAEMVLSRLSRYVYSLPAPEVDGIREVRVELSAAPMIDALEEAGRRKLLFLFLTTSFALIAAFVMIRWLTSPLTRLSETSGGLARAILNGRERVHLVKSDVLEYDTLARTMEEMAGFLAINFRAKEDLAQSLEKRVAERTAELSLMSEVALQMDEGVVVTDRSGRVTWVNAAFVQLSGYALSELQGRKPGELLQQTPPPPEVLREIQEGIASGAGFHVEVLNHMRDGTPYWVDIRCTPLIDENGVQTGFIAIETDVTERRALDQELATSLERLGLATDVANLGVWSFDRKTGTIDWNRKNYELHGLPPDIGADLQPHWRARIIDDDRCGVHQVFEDICGGETASRIFEYRYQHPTLGIRQMVATTRALEKGEDPSTIIGITRDVTVERRARDELREAAQHTAAILDNVIDAVIAIDGDGKITSYNPAAERIFGYRADEVIGRDAGLLMGGEHGEAHRGYISNFLNSGQTKVIGNISEFTAQRRNGETFPIQLAVSHVSNPKRDFFIGIVRDITVQKQLEEQLRQSQKLEAVGQLTGGIAHDFNNLLTLIIGYTEMLSDELEGQPILRDQAEKALQAAERGADLTHRLLSFSRRQSLAPKEVCVDDLIADMESLWQRSIGEAIQIDLSLDTAAWSIEIDRTQLEAALLNLCLNARDAMDGGGKIEIRTQAGPAYALDFTEGLDLPPGDYLSIVVSDTGCGMTEVQRQHAFEPFFTTKEVGKGSGLGLSMVFGFVKQSGGHIAIYSEPGKGTQIALFFPSFHQLAETGT